MTDQQRAIKQTAELRWFFDRPLAFADCLAPYPAKEQPVRHDFYLRDSGKRLGIKWREGSMEIKQQRGEAQVYQHQRVEGYLEHWKKWSFPLAERGNFDPSDDWLKVTKRRSLIRFSYDAGTQRVNLATADDEVANPCELEYTRLTVEGQEYYTLGLEASGEEDCLAKNVRQTARYLTENTTLERLGLSLTSSSNYARWIQERIIA